MTPPKRTVPVNAFSAFSGSSSPFASYSNASGASPFALSGQTVRIAPAWRRDNESESDVFGRASSANALAPSPNDAVALVTSAHPASKTALGASKGARSLTKSSTCKLSLGTVTTRQYVLKQRLDLTGEEDETVEAELKGVKLFAKRGRKEFTDGIYGHVKILSQKSTPQQTGNKDLEGTEAGTNSRTRLRKSPPPRTLRHRSLNTASISL